jgi:hypothetical protein
LKNTSLQLPLGEQGFFNLPDTGNFPVERRDRVIIFWYSQKDKGCGARPERRLKNPKRGDIL